MSKRPQREELVKFIEMITRDETPFMSNLGKEKAALILDNWKTIEANTIGNNKFKG